MRRQLLVRRIEYLRNHQPFHELAARQIIAKNIAGVEELDHDRGDALIRAEDWDAVVARLEELQQAKALSEDGDHGEIIEA